MIVEKLCPLKESCPNPVGNIVLSTNHFLALFFFHIMKKIHVSDESVDLFFSLPTKLLTLKDLLSKDES